VDSSGRAWLRAAALLLAGLLAAARAPAQDAAAPGHGATELPRSFNEIQDLIEDDTSVEPVEFTYENREIVPLRTRIFGRSPAERAESARAILDTLVERHTISPVTLKRIHGGGLLFVGGAGDEGTGVLGIADGDVAGWTGESVDAGMEKARANLALALREALERRSPDQMLWAALRAGIATVLLGMLVKGLLVLSAALLRKQKKQEEAASSRLREPVVDVTSYGVRSVGTLLLRTSRLLALGVGLLAAWIWLTYTLLQFPYLRPVGESLSGNLRSLLSSAVHTTLLSIPDLIVAALILLVARFVVRAANSFFEAVKAGRVAVAWLDPQAAEPTRKIAAFALWAFAIVLTYPYLPGSGTAAFKGVSVFLGVVISLGSTGMVGQAMAGLMLMYSRMLSLGEYVRIGESEGTVTHISMLTTRLRSVYGEELVLPNTVVMGQTTINYSRLRDAGGGQMTTDVTIGYDAPWRQVHAMLLRAAERTPGLLRDPPPTVLQINLEDFYVRYRLTVTVDVPADRIPVASVLHKNIQDEFNEHGVQIMSPHFLANPPKPVVVPKERWNAAPADPAAS
jgi:small-conductance mechanosensitive channel